MSTSTGAARTSAAVLLLSACSMSNSALSADPRGADPQGADPRGADPNPTPAPAVTARPSQWKLDTPRALELGLRLGGAVRIDDPATLSLVDRGGLLFGLGMGLFFSPRVAFGLSFEHVDLGDEDSGVLDGGSYRVVRDLNTIWLGLRLVPLQSDSVGAFVGLAVGSSWQRADVTGSFWPATQPALAQPFRCGGSAPLAFALRAELGLDAQLSGPLRAQAAMSFDNHGLSDGMLDACAAGTGSVQSVSGRAGLVYLFDL